MSRRHDSENEDDPEPFQSSGDEWDMEQAKKEEGKRRSSARISRKPKRPVVDESASDDDEEEDPEPTDSSDEEEEEETPSSKKRKINNKKGGGGAKGKTSPKKQKVSNDDELSNDTNSNISQEDAKKDREDATTDSDSSRTYNIPSRGVHRKFIPKTIYSEDYATGSFVILKKDAQGGDPSKHPVIWRIDGKALLQKYEAFDEDDKVRHKNTSIYTGWSPLDKDLYAPITVDVVRHNNNNLTVEVQWDKLKVINADSD